MAMRIRRYARGPTLPSLWGPASPADHAAIDAAGLDPGIKPIEAWRGAVILSALSGDARPAPLTTERPAGRRPG